MTDPAIPATFELLLNLMYFFDLYHAARYDEALQLIGMLNIVPLHASAVDTKAEAARQLPEPINRNMGAILLATMTCVHSAFTQLKNAPTTPTQKLQDLRDKSHAVVTFASMLQRRLPADVVARLVRMDVFLR